MNQTEKKGAEQSPPTFEQGPIRPPSEARSLLLRVTRNCPWNRCEFCPVYKGARFSRRSVDEVEADIRAMAFWRERCVEESRRLGFGGRLDMPAIQAIHQRNQDRPFLGSILAWQSGGGKTAFLQDADNLILDPGDLARMLEFLLETFPALERITTYTRSRTAAKRTADELCLLRQAGLSRVHIGLESGSDAVLEMVKKGATAKIHVEGGRKVRDAGLELSEYVMPGLGGRALSREHALETAKVLNAIDPHFIRIRSLGLREGIILFERRQEGGFQPLNDVETAAELRLMVESLEGIGSRIVSDHVLNLLPEIEGRLPDDQEKILAVLDGFLELPADEQLIYVVGRRFGLFAGMDDLADPGLKAEAARALEQLRKHGDDVHETIRQAISRFI